MRGLSITELAVAFVLMLFIYAVFHANMNPEVRAKLDTPPCTSDEVYENSNADHDPTGLVPRHVGQTGFGFSNR